MASREAGPSIDSVTGVVPASGLIVCSAAIFFTESPNRLSHSGVNGTHALVHEISPIEKISFNTLQF